MFGTIAHGTLKPGQATKLEEMNAEWKRDIRPKVPGPFVHFIGHRAGRPDEIVFLALAQDEATYRALAELPEQHAFFMRFGEVFSGEPAWEDVEMEWSVRD